MKHTSIRPICIMAFLILKFTSLCYCQAITKAELLQVTSKSDSSNKKYAAEKLYMQFDKPYYAIGDTIWFKAYLLNATYLTPSEKSGIVYVDIANERNKVIKQYRLPVQFGTTWGNISLVDDEFTAGTYIIRAYTNWMRNLGGDCFFYKRFYISSSAENNMLLNTDVKISSANGGSQADVKLQFNGMNKLPYAGKPFELQVMDGDKHLHKQKFQTDPQGFIDVNFAIPQKSSNLVLVAESDQKDKKAIIPIVLNRPENVDVQFLPEGGNLIAGLPAHIGFKAIGEDGRAVNISGVITDHEQKQLATFQSLHDGMGSFNMAVKEGGIYTAKVNLPGGGAKEDPLPIVRTSGVLLHVKDLAESDSVEVSVGATNDIVQSGTSYFLTGKARGIVCYAAILSFRDGNFIKRKIAKSLFPTGIAHFILMTVNSQPLNERLIFIDHHDNLNIQFTTNKGVYGARDSVAIKLKVTDNEGNPVSGNFSLAVTDDAQVKSDSLGTENIISRFLLTSDLKGTIEGPGYYFSSKTTDTWQALDNLLLTQGWIGYDWHEILATPNFKYEAEHEFAVKGKVTNFFNKPVANTNIILFSQKPTFLIDTSTSSEGLFHFAHLPSVDTSIYILQARNRHGRSFNVNVTVDEVTPPDFVKPAYPIMMPWYVNSDTTMLNYTKSDALSKQLQHYAEGGHLLKEVKISAKKIIRGSQNLNGPGNADQVFDEKDMEKAGKKSIFQLFEEKIPGFREGSGTVFTHKSVAAGRLQMDVVTAVTGIWYYVYYKRARIFIDGVELESVIPIVDYNDLRRYLQSHSAEDIKGIEVNFSSKYASIYELRFDAMNIPPNQYAFIEVTTRSGHGPVIDNTPGTYLYKPLPLSWPKQFYKPKYAITDTARHTTDLRSTIDWEPNITTGINGEAKVCFHTADKPSTYTLIIEGTDMNGSVGYKSGKINIKK